jgi:hypothetical protein
VRLNDKHCYVAVVMPCVINMLRDSAVVSVLCIERLMDPKKGLNTFNMLTSDGCKGRE